PRRGIVLNPGTEPAIPPVAGLADTPYWTNRDVAALTELPESLLVLGAGPVGCELAQVFARFGARVVLAETSPRLLPSSEPEASDALTGALRDDGIEVHTAATVQQVSHDGQFTAHLDTGEVITTQRLLVATGRRTDLVALGVGAAGMDDTGNTISVDEQMRAAPDVWAVGDVTGHGAFTHTSVYQARIAADALLGRDSNGADYRAAPAVTFTDPEIATIGYTEATARQHGYEVRTATQPLPRSARGFIHKAGNDGVVKLIADVDRGILIGGTVAGPAGGEIAGALAVAIHTEASISLLRRMIFAYPTFHRAIEDALDTLEL
ncbi:MAG: dihydrolipoyl dehydrogenase family protein, partial [Stackebrandtia sp.]